jgi:mRNA interferase RelE/StbE
MADYEVVLAKSARKELEKLPDRISDRILIRLEGLEKVPRPVGSLKLTGANLWRVRIGDYRVIYEIDDTKRMVDILIIQHRKNAYRGL